METPAIIAGAGAGLFPGEGGGLLEYRITGAALPMSLTLLPASVNGISERGAISEYRRTHVALDTLGGGYEFGSRLPFGAEYRLRRTLELSDGWCCVSCDASVIGAGGINTLELAEVHLRGEWSSCRIFRLSGAPEEVSCGGESAEIFSETPFRAVEFTDSRGDRLEIGVGDDWWRWTALPGGGYTLKITPGEAVFKRRIFQVPEAEETAAPGSVRKSWRCQWYWAWTPAGFDRRTVPPAERLLVPDACGKSPLLQRALRKSVRRAAGEGVRGAPRVMHRVCVDAAHLERAGKVELMHFDRCEAMRTHLWANRRLRSELGPEAGFVWENGADGAALPSELRMAALPAGGFSAPMREAEEIR